MAGTEEAPERKNARPLIFRSGNFSISFPVHTIQTIKIPEKNMETVTADILLTKRRHGI